MVFILEECKVMNERIKELAEQAELTATLLFNKEKLEKFARLIVQECIVQIGNQPVRIEHISGQSFKYIQLGETISTIKEQFEVDK